MKKITLLAAILLTTIMCLTGCDYAVVENAEDIKQVEDDKTSMFVLVEKGPSWKILYHKETKVMYAVSFDSHNCGTFTLLVNPDGTPMLYEE